MEKEAIKRTRFFHNVKIYYILFEPFKYCFMQVILRQIYQISIGQRLKGLSIDEYSIALHFKYLEMMQNLKNRHKIYRNYKLHISIRVYYRPFLLS